MISKNIKIFFFLYLALIMMSLPFVVVMAQGGVCIGGVCSNGAGPCTSNAQCGGLPSGRPITLSEIDFLIGRIGGFLITISITIAVIVIVWGGIRYMASGSKDATEARTIIKNGIIGAAVVLAAGVILQTVAGVVNRGFFF